MASPQCLQRSHLYIHIKKILVWISKLENLIRLELGLVGSANDSMRDTKALRNLLVLLLTVIYCDDEELHLKKRWFPKLQCLCLSDFIKLKWMMIEKGAMPALTKLMIGPCSLLKEIPARIKHLRNLKKPFLNMMLEEVYCMIKIDNWEKLIIRIPLIHASYKCTIKG